MSANIRERRADLQMSQEHVAESMGITTRHFQKIEAGDLNITLKTLCNVATALKTTPAELISVRRVHK